MPRRLGLALPALLAAAPAAAATDCDGLADLRLDDANLLSAVTVPAAGRLLEFCSVRGYAVRETASTAKALVTTRTGADGQVEWSRPVCAWPQVARYDGTGDWHKPESFTCAAP